MKQKLSDFFCFSTLIPCINAKKYGKFGLRGDITKYKARKINALNEREQKQVK